jgi:hypothetical protein
MYAELNLCLRFTDNDKPVKDLIVLRAKRAGLVKLGDLSKRTVPTFWKNYLKIGVVHKISNTIFEDFLPPPSPP